MDMVPSSLASTFTTELAQRLIALRRDLHRHPELSFQEERTASALYDQLASLEPLQLERVAGTGVVARIKGRDSGAPTVAIRGDIDALPIVADGVNALRSKERAIVLVTHYQRLLNYIVPDRVHVLAGGSIARSGDKDLALMLEDKGYGWIEDSRAPPTP